MQKPIDLAYIQEHTQDFLPLVASVDSFLCWMALMKVLVMQELEKHGVILEAATEIVDNTEAGKLVFYIKGYMLPNWTRNGAETRQDAVNRPC